MCVCISYGSLSSLWFPSPVRNGKAKFLPPSHASTRRERTRHTCFTFATRHSSSAEREASRRNREGDHRPPEELGTASSAVCCVWRREVTKFRKVRTAGQTSCITPLQGMGMEESVYGLSAVSTVWRILNTSAMTPASSWFICNICGETHSLERNYPDNSFYLKSCWIFSEFQSNTYTQNAFVELNWKGFHLNWL